MKAVKNIVSSVGREIKTRSRKGYQALTRSFTRLRGRIIGAKARRIVRKSPRSTGGG